MLDLRYALRRLVKDRGFTAIATLALGLGIGVNLAIFSTIDALMLRPLPISGIDRMVSLVETAPIRSVDRMAVSPANFVDWREQSATLEAVTAYDFWDVNLIDLAEPQRVQGALVTWEFFDGLGIRAAQGRTFTETEESRGNHLVVVVSHAFWMRQFGGDQIINTTLNLNGEAYTVIGIAPEEFTFPYSADVWAPMLLDGETATNRQAHYVEAFGRLRPDVSLGDAQTELNLVAARLESDYPDTNSGQGVRVMTLAEGIRDRGAGPFLAVVFASTGLVLLIACVNVANMLLARGAARQKELALRVAHGASVQRIGRLLLTESLLLSLAGTAAALAFAWFGIAVIRSSMPAEIARLVAGWGEIDIDGRLVGFGLGLSLATTILFGALPAWRAARPDLVETLKEGGRTGDTAGGRSRLQGSLIIGEMALALMLLVAAALTTQGALALLNGDHGYDPTNVLTLRVTLPDARYEEPNQLRQFFTDTVDRLKTLPGVVDAAIVSSLPSSNSGASHPVMIEGQTPPLPEQAPVVNYRTMSPEYLRTLGIPLLQGRALASQDDEDAPPVAVVSRSFALRFWPDQEPVGRRFKIGQVDEGQPWIEVVGVSGDVMHNWFQGRAPIPMMYLPSDQATRQQMDFAIRVAGDPTQLAAGVRAEFRTIDPDQPIHDMMTMRELMNRSMIGLSYIASMMATSGVIALLLAALGIYGVMSYSVGQRTHEIGVRMALGAGPRQVIRMVLERVLALSAGGVVLGLVGAYALSRAIIAALDGVVSMNAVLFVVFSVFLTGVALAAAWVPAQRALRVDPIAALRVE